MNNICVYCGSRPGRVPDYVAAAEKLAHTLVERDLGLVYGGSARGIMGALADAVMTRGGRVTGVMPADLVNREIPHPGITELRSVSSMHERKALMAKLSNGFIALPGGLGTLEEILEMLTWAQLGFHKNPCGLLNVNGYYDKLVSFFKVAVEEDFVQDLHINMLIVEVDASTMLDRFEKYVAPSAKQ